MIKLSSQLTKSMLVQPETGMGYQTVEVDCTVEIRKGTIYNCEILLWESEPQIYLTEAHYERMVKTASSSEAQRIQSIKVVQPPYSIKESSTFDKFAEGILGKPATEGNQKETNAAAVFMRFTAYKNDRRITPRQGLLPGTYATTEADARRVKTGGQAVERYSLPDPKPAKYRYKIIPLEKTVYREGVVQPAYGQKGGGVEVIFDNGTDDNTVTGLIVLPEK